MKAYVLHNIGDIRLDECSEPKLNKNEVLLKVRAVGICGSDIPRIYNTGAYNHPLIPGHEFSGEVVKLGEEVSKVWLNKRVGVFPLIPCYECHCCRNKQYEMCKNYSYLGSRQDGGFAEFVAVPVENLIELPNNVTFQQAAMLEPMAVGIHSIRKAFNVNDLENIKDKDKTICVCGLGTIGLLIFMFLKEFGFKNVYLIGNKETQKKLVTSMGLEEKYFCDTNKFDSKKWLENLTGGIGIDIFFECVGKNETIKLAVESAAPSGKIILLGNPYSDLELEKAIYWKVLRSQLTLIGSWNSSFTKDENDDWEYVIKLLKDGRINPEKFITHNYDLDDLENGFLIMKNKSEEYVKIMCNLN